MIKKNKIKNNINSESDIINNTEIDSSSISNKSEMILTNNQLKIQQFLEMIF